MFVPLPLRVSESLIVVHSTRLVSLKNAGKEKTLDGILQTQVLPGSMSPGRRNIRISKNDTFISFVRTLGGGRGGNLFIMTDKARVWGSGR